MVVLEAESPRQGSFRQGTRLIVQILHSYCRLLRLKHCWRNRLQPRGWVKAFFRIKFFLIPQICWSTHRYFGSLTCLQRGGLDRHFYLLSPIILIDISCTRLALGLFLFIPVKFFLHRFLLDKVYPCILSATMIEDLSLDTRQLLILNDQRYQCHTVSCATRFCLFFNEQVMTQTQVTSQNRRWSRRMTQSLPLYDWFFQSSPL